MLLIGAGAAFLYASAKVYTMFNFSGSMVAPTCQFGKSEAMDYYDAIGNRTVIWVVLGDGQLSYARFVFDLLISLSVFISPLWTIYGRIYNFYSEISVRSLFYQKDDTVSKLVSNLYFIRSDDLEEELHQTVGKRSDGKLSHYAEEELEQALPRLKQAGKVGRMEEKVEVGGVTNSGELAAILRSPAT